MTIVDAVSIEEDVTTSDVFLENSAVLVDGLGISVEEVTTSDVFLENSAVLVAGLGISQVVSDKIVKNMLVNTLLSCCNI